MVLAFRAENPRKAPYYIPIYLLTFNIFYILQELLGVKVDVSKGETVEYAGRAIVGLMNGLNVDLIIEFVPRCSIVLLRFNKTSKLSIFY